MLYKLQAIMEPCPTHISTFWELHPPVGVFIGILAVVGVVVPLCWDVTKIGKWQKAAWTVLMFALLGLELRTLYLDRAENNREQEHARCEQLENFRKIANQLKDNFQTTMTGVSSVFDKAKEASENAKEAVDTMMGNGGFCYIVIGDNRSPNLQGALLPLLKVEGAKVLWRVSARVMIMKLT